MKKTFKRIFAVIIMAVPALLASGQTRFTTPDELSEFIGRDNAVWEPNGENEKFIYFKSNGTGLRCTTSKTGAEVRKQFTWKAISPSQVVLKMKTGKRMKRDTLEITEKG